MQHGGEFVELRKNRGRCRGIKVIASKKLNGQWTAGLGLFVPYGTQLDYGNNWPGRYALTKIDLAAPSRQAQVMADVGHLLAGTGLEGADIVPVSTVTGGGIEDLRARLFDAAYGIKARASAERFRLAVDRSFTLAGAGTVRRGRAIPAFYRAHRRN